VKPWGGRAGIDFAFSEDQLAIRAAIEKICSFDLPHLRPRTEEQRNTMLMRATLSFLASMGGPGRNREHGSRTDVSTP
jgi:hypothetical protein